VVLTHDLLGCRGDGLVVGASGITIDLGGHTVAGTVSDDSVGIRNAGRAHVLVKNGVVRGSNAASSSPARPTTTTTSASRRSPA
jgi:hypothetical protein